MKPGLFTATTLKETLEVVFRLSDDDLTCNRQGKISAAQEQRIQDKHRDNVYLARLVMVWFSAIGMLGSSAAALHAGIALTHMWSAVALALLIIGLFVLLMLHYSRARMQRTLNAVRVECASGEISFTASYNGGKTRTHYLAVGSHRFPLNANGDFLTSIQTSYRLNQLVTSGQCATVYYTRPWVSVLSVDLNASPEM